VDRMGGLHQPGNRPGSPWWKWRFSSGVQSSLRQDRFLGESKLKMEIPVYGEIGIVTVFDCCPPIVKTTATADPVAMPDGIRTLI